ncbi:RHS repeat-associated core domain-containing protein [Flavobacterium sp. ACN6]|uniref:RHS repeat-associated core domain-containing protein n=1 Tax=Flavobacterium sp. ACN6 TaxID=1920426 RepID=UPI001D5A479E|nr:RHS repeat-associated core domain-containing protein [Flavobacterium sp. ACN6]PBJ08069.1 tRNA3(Ser)-specific nuclease WapA precursor [Flavobacterium sp. ACN6]
MTVLVPASIKILRLRLDAVGSGNVWFDDVQIRKAANAPAINKELLIEYNVFKSPVEITEEGVDKIDFVYNDDNQRSTMFYGSLDDKLNRPFRKHYSSDGTMEIKENRVTNTFEFVTYLGGDGYSAPAVLKSDGNSQNVLYLQRDFQGSILSITDSNGNVLEKRLFDAWGGIIKVQDGAGAALNGLTVLDRGYTGHEHIQSIGIIKMNGRLYDPKLRRFLQPDNNIQDPFNTQNFNRYGYVLNNPLKYTDPSGEFWNFIGGLLFSAYIHGGASSGEINPFKWNLSTWMTAFTGTASSLASSYATGRANSYIENYNNKPVLGESSLSSGNEYTAVYHSNITGAENSRYNYDAFKSAGIVTAGLVADDVTGIGVADDVLIPVAWGAATTVWVWDNREVIKDDAREIVDAIHRSLDPKDFHYVTYTKTSFDGRLVYVGRSSGYGTPEDIVKRRDADHHLNKGLIKYGTAELSSSLPATIPGGYGERYDDPAYWAIRGSEQIQIEQWRKKGMSGNTLNGISPTNRMINKYLKYGIKLLF